MTGIILMRRDIWKPAGSGMVQTWYYLQENGAMLKNCWISNYYVGDNGAMYTDRWTPDGYYVGGDGLWIPEK